ncbi:MAG: DUF4012 domain-containing protein [Acidimicrobiales bacterium]
MVVLAAVGAVAAVLGGAAPTGITLVDAAYVGAAGAALAFAGGRARRVSWLISGVLALWFTPTSLGRVVAIAAVVVAVWAARQGRRRSLGAIVGALLAFVLGDLGSGPFLGSTFLLAALAAAPILASGLRGMPTHWRRPVTVGLSTWAAAAVLATGLFGVSSLLATTDVTDGIDAANQGFDLAADTEQEGSATAFEHARDRFESARSKVSGFWTLPARLVPVVGQHARAVQVVTAEGVALTSTAADAARSVDPSDVRLIGGRLDLRVVERLQPVLARTERAVDRAIDRVDDARSPWLATPLDERMDDLLTELADTRPSAHTASVAVRTIPELMGADEPVHWLVGVTTPAEARGLGGLLGNWVLIEADDGALSMVASGRNEDINTLLRERNVELTGPAQYVERWSRYSPNEFFQDVTLSPDLPMVAAVAADLFEQATDERIDGVIVVDPFAIGALLRLVGPVEVDDLTLTGDRVVPFLLEDQYLRYADDEVGRVSALAQLINGAFSSFTSGALPGPTTIADGFGPVIDQDRIGFWWRGGDADELFELTGLDGEFPIPTSDMVALVHQNAGQNKLDTHLRRALDYRLDIVGTEATGTITVTLHNDLDDLTLPAAIIASNDQGYPLGTNVARLAVHTALDFRAARLDGEETTVERDIAFGHDALTVLIEVPAGGTRTLTIEVGGTLDPSSYSLSLPQQPLVNDDAVTIAVTVDGTPLDLPPSLDLDVDTVLRPGGEADPIDR